MFVGSIDKMDEQYPIASLYLRGYEIERKKDTVRGLCIYPLETKGYSSFPNDSFDSWLRRRRMEFLTTCMHRAVPPWTERNHL